MQVTVLFFMEHTALSLSHIFCEPLQVVTATLHKLPAQPGRQEHSKLAVRSVHVAPFLQGDELHSLMSVKQLKPL